MLANKKQYFNTFINLLLAHSFEYLQIDGQIQVDFPMAIPRSFPLMSV